MLNIDHGRQRFALFAFDGARREGECTTPAMAWIDQPAGGARVGPGAFAVSGWAFKDGVGLAKVEIMKDEDWQAILDTNLTSVYRTSKAVMRSMMKARKGRIINIASVVGVTGNPGQANYAAAKAGVIAFSKSLAREIGSRGVTVNVVAPGFIDTDMDGLCGASPRKLRTIVALDSKTRRAPFFGYFLWQDKESDPAACGRKLWIAACPHSLCE